MVRLFNLLLLLLVASCSAKPPAEKLLARLRSPHLDDSQAIACLFDLRWGLRNAKTPFLHGSLTEMQIADVIIPYLRRSRAVRNEAFEMFGDIRDVRVLPFLKNEVAAHNAEITSGVFAALDNNGGVAELDALLARLRLRPDSQTERIIFSMYLIGSRNREPAVERFREVIQIPTLSSKERARASELRELLEKEMRERSETIGDDRADKGQTSKR